MKVVAMLKYFSPLSRSLPHIVALIFFAGVGGKTTAVEAAPRVAAPSAGTKVDFDREIRPLFSDRCFHCHGPDAESRKGGFRLDQQKSALGLSDSGEHPIVPGKPEASELIRRITADDVSERMPPKDSGKTLSKDEIELLRRWIAEGAQWQKHWAFVRPARPAEPSVKDPHWARGPIDRFVLARLEAEGLKPSPEASREALIRRLSFDLTGLPPTLKEIDAFLTDRSDQAYEKVVDLLLASPHYGERMAVEWLDGARFAETNGYQNDFARDMSPWRDWVIQAYNSNMRYDEFVVEQLAGDLLPHATTSQKVATGFLRNNRSVTEAGSIEEEWRTENMIDRVETTSVVLMGLTMGCARCHDHKYDPISQREFYRFLAFFNSTKDRGFYSETRGNTGPMISVIQPEQQRRIDEFDTSIAKAERDVARPQPGEDAAFAKWLKQIRDTAPSKSPPVASVGVPLHGDLQITTEKQHQPGGKILLATFAGRKPSWGDGLAGKVLKISGRPKAYVDLGEAVPLNRDGKFSLCCWVRPDGPGALWSKMDDPAANRGFDTLVFGDGRVELHMIHHWPENAIKVSTKERLRMGQWNHLCITYDGSSKAQGIKIYIDGQKASLDVVANSLTATIATPQPFRLGRRSASLFYKGALSDFRFFDRILASDEIRPFVSSTLAAAVKMRGGTNAAHEKILQDYFESHSPDNPRMAAQATLAKLRAAKDAYLSTAAIPTVMVLDEMDKPRPTYILKRGQYDAPDTSQSLDPGVPEFLPPLPSGAPVNRLGLARWLVDPANPLVARVEVNRLWGRLFGTGLVTTPDNLGSQGEPPANPELLDWLATELVRTGWDIKALEKEIVMSATYRQSSAINAELAKRDPDNRLLDRGPRHRLSAEEIRDNALSVSGLLSLKIGGPSVKPYQPPGLWEELAGGAGEGAYVQDTGENLHRRSLYTYRKRTVPHPTTSTFDAPTWESCTAKRSRTNTPLQALALLNDETYIEAARALAQRMMQQGGTEIDARLRYGFRLAIGRAPAPKEVERLTAAYNRYRETYVKDPAAAKTLLSVGEFSPDARLEKIDLAAYATIASVLLNLDETITDH
jgi:mono/diheme cytochrome c family protein